MTIASVLARKGNRVVTVTAEQTVREALRLLVHHSIGAVLVVDAEGKPCGMLSERDIVHELARQERVLDLPVGGVMTRHVIVGSPADDLASVVHTMTERRIRHLPVMDKGSLVGIVSIGDVMKAQRDHYQGEVDTLQLQLLKGQP